MALKPGAAYHILQEGAIHELQQKQVSDIQIAYIGGGSRGWAWTFMTDLALDEQISGTIRLYDIDRSAAENNAVIGNRLMSREDAGGDWKLR